jgi:PAS domain S-box-containing protein
MHEPAQMLTDTSHAVVPATSQADDPTSEQVPSASDLKAETTKKQIRRYVFFSLAYLGSYILLERFTVNPQLASGPSVWYPPAGLTFALLLGGGPWYLPVVILTLATSEYVNLGTPFFSWFGLFSSSVTGIGYTLGTLLLRRRLRTIDSAQVVRNVTFYLAAACFSALFVAMAGTASLAITLGKGWANYWQFTFHWWLGDGVALLCTTPFLLMFAFPESRAILGFPETFPGTNSLQAAQWTSWQMMEVGAQAIGILSIFAILFVSPLSRQNDLFYLFFLPVIWIALIHGLRGAITAAFALNVGMIALYPSTISTAEVIIKVHILQLSVAVAGMVLGASISEREYVRAQLLRRTTYFEELISNNPIATVVHGADGAFQMCNPAFERLFQFKYEEMVGKTIDEIVAPKDLNLEATALTMRAAAGEHVHVVTRRRRKDGTLLDVEAHGVPLRVGGRPIGVLSLYEDLTERKRLEEQILLSGKLQAVGRLAGGVAHDFNNIIAVIQGYAELLLERLPSGSDLRDSAEEIMHSSKRATGMTRQLLAFSRKQVLELRVTDLNAIVQDFKKMLLRLIPEDIEQVFQSEETLGLIKADKGQIEQIIMNLAVNARDAMSQGGILTIETYNIVMDESQAALYMGAKPGSYVVLSVTDTGIGMDAETKALIFDPFFSTKDKDKGTGLGLATVYGIVHHSGGFIIVDSAPGKGSTFRVHFPLVEGELAAAAEKPEKETVSTSTLGGKETILVAEDEDALREMMRISLERVGYTVLEAHDGAEAIEIAQMFEGHIDLLLTDVIMPKLRGPQSAKYISFLRPGIKTIFMSGYTDGAIEKKDLLMEAAVFLQKPFSRADVLSKIREVLELSANNVPAEIAKS